MSGFMTEASTEAEAHCTGLQAVLGSVEGSAPTIESV